MISLSPMKNVRIRCCRVKRENAGFENKCSASLDRSSASAAFASHKRFVHRTVRSRRAYNVRNIMQ